MVSSKSVPGDSDASDHHDYSDDDDDYSSSSSSASLSSSSSSSNSGPRGRGARARASARAADAYCSSDSDDDSSFDSVIDKEAERLMTALGGNLNHGGCFPSSIIATTTTPIPKKTPQQLLEEYLVELESGKSTAIKIPDHLVSWIVNDDIPGEGRRQELVSDLCRRIIAALKVVQQNNNNNNNNNEIKHVVLGKVILQLMTQEQHINLYKALLEDNDSRLASTITYWKFGSDDSVEPIPAIPTSILLQLLLSAKMTALTEIELRGLVLDDNDDDSNNNNNKNIDQCVQLIKRTASSLKLFNLLGMVMSPKMINTAGLLDPILDAVGPVENLDEVQLTRNVKGDDDVHVNVNVNGGGADTTTTTSPTSLVSPATLQHLLDIKPKWWRFALDGMGLTDDHTSIIGTALLQTSSICKMNDLLSIQNNPRITSNGLRHLYKICINKARMGLVLSDDPSWVATFNLVRPLNNLHRRLEYLKKKDDNDDDDDTKGGGTTTTTNTYTYISKEKWIEWLVVLNNLPWLDDTRKLNYVWFTLLDQPDMVTNCGGRKKE